MASALVAAGSMTSSAVLVHAWDGVIEAHFHFLVMILVLALYEDWVTFLIAAAYVVGHHASVGLLEPHAVYNHPDAVAHPLKWAVIHGVFVAAAGAASVVGWRLNEVARLEAARAERERRAAAALVERQRQQPAEDAGARRPRRPAARHRARRPSTRVRGRDSPASPRSRGTTDPACDRCWRT